MKRLLKSLATIALTLGMLLSANAMDKPTTWTTEEGASVYYLNLPELPILDLIIALDAGNFREGDQHGLASLTASLLVKGTENRDEETLIETMEGLATSITAGSNTTQTTIRYRSLTDEEVLTLSVDLLLEILKSPRFDEATFNREVAQIIDAQKARLDNQNSLASEAYYAMLYPGQHLGSTSEMLVESLKKLSTDDLKVFKERYYHSNNAKIIIVGDLSLTEAKALANRISETLGTGEAQPAINETPLPSKGETKVIAFDSPQSRIMMGHPAIDRFDPDYFALFVGNHVLGGSGLTSELMMDIREKQGLTYGIYSYFSPSFLKGPFTISLSTTNQDVDHAISETKKLVKRFIEEGPSEEALTRAKNNLTGSMALDLDSNMKMASALLSIATYQLPLDYFEQYADNVNHVTREMIQAAFKKHVDVEKLSTVIVGGYQETP